MAQPAPFLKYLSSRTHPPPMAGTHIISQVPHPLPGDETCCISYTSAAQTKLKNEPLMRIELTTSSLPRKCSTPELQRLVPFSHRSCPLAPDPSPACPPKGGPSSAMWSGRRGSNPRPTAWKAVALPTELLPHFPSDLRRTSGPLVPFDLRRTSGPQKRVGKDGFEPPNSEEDRFTVCCRWPLGYLPVFFQHRENFPTLPGTHFPFD